MSMQLTGGIGYIDSHACVELLHVGHEVVVLDNLSNGSSAKTRAAFPIICHPALRGQLQKNVRN